MLTTNDIPTETWIGVDSQRDESHQIKLPSTVNWKEDELWVTTWLTQHFQESGKTLELILNLLIWNYNRTHQDFYDYISQLARCNYKSPKLYQLLYVYYTCHSLGNSFNNRYSRDYVWSINTKRHRKLIKPHELRYHSLY